LEACHSSAVGGHFGIPVTYRCMKQVFAWKNINQDVQSFVQACMTCQQAKPDMTKAPGLLQPLSVPKRAWQTISIDFVEGLPLSGSANCILVIVDKFIKYAHFLPLKHPFTTYSAAKLFMENVYKLNGLLTAIVSDRDRVFTSNLWKELFALANVQLRMSSSYHPQSNG
jgi:hypothetical protein